MTSPEIFSFLSQYGAEMAGILVAIIGGSLFYRQRKRANTPKPFAQGEEITQTQETSLSLADIDRALQPKSPWGNVLKKTREKWFGLSRGEKILREHLEEALLGADVGYKCSQQLLDGLDFAKNWSELQQELSGKMAREFENIQSHIVWPQKKSSPHVILVVGVNGVGKTTSIAKLARELKADGQKVLLAAGDTFRAAASEQLALWAERLEIPCIRGGENADSSAVLFDAIKAGQARGADFVICDSAGRLHNNDQLMENLSKNKRVIDKAQPGAPHDIVLVLDANTGQNMLNQGKKFLELGLTALILTKIDGSAKGGAVFPLMQELKLPIVRLGVGEGEADLMPFDSLNFSRALVGAEGSGP